MAEGDDYFDFPPRQMPAGVSISTEQQVANAATYMMHQSFHIRRALERIADALEAGSPKKPREEGGGYVKGNG